MTLVSVIYHSATGTTDLLAKGIEAGAAEFAEAKRFRIVGADIVDGRFVNETVWDALDASHAIVFGSPTFMGGPSAQFKAFADATGTGDRWSEQRWRNKLAAGFTVGTSPNGDQGATVGYFSILASQHGMLWLGLDIPNGSDPLLFNRLGTQIGLTTQAIDDKLSDSDLATARHFGARIAGMAGRLAGGG